MEKKQYAYKIGPRSFTHEEVAMLALGTALEKKAYHPVLIDLRKVGAFTEYFAIVSASNTRQVYAIAEGIRQYFRSHFDLLPLSMDGVESSSWILLDYGFLFVHVFQEATRDVYQLEHLWNKATLIEFSAEKCEQLVLEVEELNKN